MRDASGKFVEGENVPECAGELQRICADIERLANSFDVRRPPLPEVPKAPREEIEIGSELHLRLIARNRARRSKFFNAHLFADPAWDMLIDLYRAKLGHQKVSVTSVCLASGVAATTALRWLKALEVEGLVSRSKDPDDSRRIFVELTADGEARMLGYFAAAQEKLVA